MRNKIAVTIKKYAMTEPGQRVLCALSGGADSCAMVHILAEISTELGIEIAAAHFSHGLRPECAKSEHELCKNLCDRLNIPLFHGSGDTNAYCAERKISTEQGARQLRYEFLQEIAEKWGAHKIATAHNLGDNAETVLFNLVRGSGARGLCGIPYVRGNIIRPILDISRAEIEKYNEEMGVLCAHDLTNDENDYARNKIRNLVLPILSEINSGAVDNIAACSAILAEDLDFFDRCTAQITDLAVKTATGIEIKAALIRDIHPALSARVIIALCKGEGFSPSRRQIDSILHIAKGKNPSASVDLSGNLCARRENGKLIIGQPPKTDKLPTILLEYDSPVLWGDFEITMHSGAVNCEYDLLSYIIRCNSSIFVRSRQVGDHILIGEKTKSVKKFMIDQKIPQKKRDITPLICDNDRVRAILWRREQMVQNAEMVAITARHI